MPSIVDTRQPENLTTPFVRAGWTRTKLQYGDYAITEVSGRTVLIEDKPVSKLLGDMVEGVLQRQVRGLIASCEFPILLIRGSWSRQGEVILNSRITWGQAWNQLASIQDAGYRLQIVTGTAHAIDRIFELEKYYQKGTHDSMQREPAGDYKLAVLSMIDGISEEKAKIMLLGCGESLLDVAMTSAEGLEERCSGIGSILAHRIYDFWRK